MKYDITQTFKDLNDEIIPEGTKADKTDEKPFTLGSMLTLACLNADPQKYSDGMLKYRIYKLICRLNSKATELEFSAEDLVLLKDLVGKIFSPYLVGVIYDALEKTVSPPEAPPPTEASPQP